MLRRIIHIAVCVFTGEKEFILFAGAAVYGFSGDGISVRFSSSLTHISMGIVALPVGVILVVESSV